ncbi:MAG: hypothetical protein ABH828_00840 [archaeon]
MIEQGRIEKKIKNRDKEVVPGAIEEKIKGRTIEEPLSEDEEIVAALKNKEKYSLASLEKNISFVFKEGQIPDKGLEIVLKGVVADAIKYRDDMPAVPQTNQELTVQEAKKLADQAYDLIGKRILMEQFSVPEDQYKEILEIEDSYGNKKAIADSNTEYTIGMKRDELKKEFVNYRKNLFDSIDKILLKTETKRAEKLSPEREEEMFSEMNEYYKKEDYQKAMKVLNRILLRNPNSGRAWGLKGLISKLYLNDLETAEHSYRIATMINPKNITNQRALGHLLRDQGKNEEEANKAIMKGYGMDKI